jgi:hypothetical protein
VVLEATKIYPWDEFLEDNNRRHVEAWRRLEWPNILHQLSRAPFHIMLPEGLEPCWVLPGKAVFWQEQSVRQGVTKTDDQGREYRVAEVVSNGWSVTHPFPANSASAIAYQLRKGLRLRPPGQEVVETGTMAPVEGSTQTEQMFVCTRHGFDRKAFATWKGYLHHCQYYKEAPDENPPWDVLERAKTFPYFCMVHNKGFQNHAGATRHRTTELKRSGKSYHPSVEDMKVNEDS